MAVLRPYESGVPGRPDLWTESTSTDVGRPSSFKIDDDLENGSGGGALQTRKWPIEVEWCPNRQHYSENRIRSPVFSSGVPLELVEPDTLRYKVMEPILLLGKERFAEVIEWLLFCDVGPIVCLFTRLTSDFE